MLTFLPDRPMKSRRPVLFSTILIYRFLGGLAVGGSSVVAPMYIAEIAPSEMRGRLVMANQLNVVTGILLAFFSNYLVAQAFDAAVAWRWMFGVEAFPAALFFACLAAAVLLRLEGDARDKGPRNI